jgi:two-component system phosphate regulon sensor histidine kinase PhoR
MSFIDTKNLSPKQLSFITAGIIAIVNTILGLVLQLNFQLLLIIFSTTFIITYFLYYYTLQYFIYRKIKLIYKFIYQTKATKREEYFYDNILPQKSIEEVSKDVQLWAAQRKDEIEMLRRNETFRKEFLMNLAHELRTPIFTVQGYVETLIGGALEDPTVNLKFLHSTSKSIDRLVQLVDDLDEISRLESGSAPLLEEKFLIQETIRDVYEEFTLQSAEKNISLEIKKGTERPLEVYADKSKIRQVLTNLIENALKYGHSGGNIIASCYDMDETHIYIEISDDGPGIAEEHLPRVFERFYRADRSRNRNIGGTGLGLAIVKHIIEAHGQTVNVRSKPGVGSSFGFTLAKG